MANRKNPLDELQVGVLERISAGDALSDPEDSVLHRTVYALRSRGLVEAAKRGGRLSAKITDAGRYYLMNGTYPTTPAAAAMPVPAMATTRAATATSRSSSPIRAAKTLIAELETAADRTLRITDPDPDSRAAYRRAIHAAKQHGLVPDGLVLRHTGRGAGDIVVRLLDAANPDETDWNRVRLNLRKPKPAEFDLREMLIANLAAVPVSDGQRDRAVDLLVALDTEARRHNHSVKLLRRGRHAKLGYLIGETQWYLNITEQMESETIPEKGRNPRYWTATRTVPSGRLQITIDHRAYIDQTSKTKPLVWSEDRRSTLSTRLRMICGDVQGRFDLLAKEADESRRKREAEHAAWQRQQEVTRRDWEAAMAAARPQAVDALRHATLIAALTAWRDARDLREICDVIDARARAAEACGDDAEVANLDDWRDAGRALADSLDPTVAPGSLADVDFRGLEPGPDDLRPYLGTWSPAEPRPEYYARPASELKPSKPWPRAWYVRQRG